MNINMRFVVADSNHEMGRLAAAEAAKELEHYTGQLKKEMLVVFAAAPSQDTFLEQLAKEKGIDWRLVTAFHLDEYLDLPHDHPNTFKTYLKETIFDKISIPAQNINYIKDIAGTGTEVAEEYGRRFLGQVDRIRNAGGKYIAFIGIGVNGHIAFNEPHSDIYASLPFFNVTIDEVSVQQQFDDYKNHPNPAARYAKPEDVPRNALSLSVAGLLNADSLYCMVPGSQKADAVKGLLEDGMGPGLPATYLRSHRNIKVFVDKDAAGQLSRMPELV